METAKIFTNGRSQAVRLPRKYRFEGEEVLVQKLGKAVLLIPKDAAWETAMMGLEGFTDDFMNTREDVPVQERAPL